MAFYTIINQDFEKKKQTLDRLMPHVLHDKVLKGFDKGLMCGMILIDFQKAFDMTEHNILLNRMRAINFSNHTTD